MNKNFFDRFLLFFSKILLGCLLGLVIILFYASRSSVVRQEIKAMIQKNFKELYNCDFDGHIQSMELLTLHVEFIDMSVVPLDPSDEWSFYTHKFHITASWLAFVLYRRFICHAYFEQGIVYEKLTKKESGFLTVLAKMFADDTQDGPSLNYITVKQGQLMLKDATGDFQLQGIYNCQISHESDGSHTKLYILDGSCLYKDATIFENFFGNYISIVPYNNDQSEIYARTDCRLSIPKLGDKGACFLVGDVYRGHGAFVISNDDQSFIIEPLKIKLQEQGLPITCSVTMQSDIVQQLVASEILMPDLLGTVTMNAKADLYDMAQTIEGSIELQNFVYKHNQLVDKACINFEKHDTGYSMQTFINGLSVLNGLCKPDENKQETFVFDMINTIDIQPWWNRYWTIPAGKGSLVGAIDTTSCQVQGSYVCDMLSPKLDLQETVQGFYMINQDQIKFDGSLLDKKYQGVIQLRPEPSLLEFRYFSDDEIVIDFHENQDLEKGTVGFIAFNFIKSLLPAKYKSSFSQPGNFVMNGNLQRGSYHARVATDNAHIRIPSLYNVLQDFTATMTFDFMSRSIIIDSMIAHLYEGTVKCDHAVAIFDNQTQTPFLHIPLFLDSVLMSWNKGIFGIVSGKLFLSQNGNNGPELQGDLLVDKAQLKGNIFSKEFQDQLIGAVGSAPTLDIPGTLDIAVQTKDPIAVETSFLQAMVNLDLHISNTIKNPQLEGTIDISDGELKFPYKSLFITNGTIAIMPKNSTEPTIEFTAKGKIKRYDITMHATGTMMDQQIHFEASPYLSEEEIISLLLVGSQDSSLTMVMSTMFMQKLREIIFGPAMSKSKLDVMFNRLLQSFKNIRIFPQFTNQTGRGGVRGIIEVDATDRLHGRIDSNLMQLEDTIFEADYMITDDVMIRAIKDGPSTYGGEVEMRWKF